MLNNSMPDAKITKLNYDSWKYLIGMIPSADLSLSSSLELSLSLLFHSSSSLSFLSNILCELVCLKLFSPCDVLSKLLVLPIVPGLVVCTKDMAIAFGDLFSWVSIFLPENSVSFLKLAVLLLAQWTW